MFAGGISLQLVKLNEQRDFCRQENSHLHLNEPTYETWQLDLLSERLQRR